MRHLRSTIATAAALLLSGTALGTAVAQPIAQPVAGPAAPPAAVSSLYAPSALVLTVAKGTSAAPSTVERAVTLDCAPRATGTHPSAAAACRELNAVDGDFAALPSELPQTLCTREWDPVTVSANGVWRGERVAWSGTYNNGCEMTATLGVVFSF
ncbi:subtilase-type protease inhibitor [Streptomyces sp. NPDC017979]|uniref:subtilase-type protease inhibitor n=1 Tax=Streptomyces sp. NPDC017979 TaxID=3365024 RepID=UPI0037A73962